MKYGRAGKAERAERAGKNVRAGKNGGGTSCHVLKMVYSYFASLIYVFYFLS